MSAVCIVVPVYKDELERYESISLEQCCKILYTYPIVLVTYSDLNLEKTKEYILHKFPNTKISIANFDKAYFKDISAYNKLMLSAEFYEYFRNYDCILIHQLDAFVFKDELNYWAERKYDYIGAPWFQNYGEGNDNQSLWQTGNGGLSLRNPKTFLKILKKRGPVKGLNSIVKEYQHLNATQKLLKSPVVALKLLGIRNNISYYVEKFHQNEDTFWSSFASKYCNLSVPGPEEALKFSFECAPLRLYKMNSNNLPFGCHAWWRYDLDFWKPFIKASGYDL